MGMPGSEFVGKFEGDVLTVSNKGPRGHSRAVFDLREPGRDVFRMEMSPDGANWQAFMEGRYSKDH